MTKEQQDLELLKGYINAVIDEKISNAFGRDGLHEAIARAGAEKELDEAFGL